MSRIGRLPIPVPDGVDVTIDGRLVTVTGPKGTLSRELHAEMLVSRENGTVVVARPTEQKTHKQLHGLSRKPEPYKGKGVRYAGEQVRRKAGKAGKIGGKK